MIRRLFEKKIYTAHTLFHDHFIDVRMLYVLEFNKVPAISFIGELDITKALAMIREKKGKEIVSILQHTYFDHAEKKMYFNNTILKLSEHRMIELAGNYCQVLHKPVQSDWAIGLLQSLAEFHIQVVNTDAPAPVIGFARQSSMN
ncbi:MAG: hypothetical protein WKF35_06740 [Ferruginibacter sp.]